METLRLSQLIGDEIAEIRYHYVPKNEYGLQEFHSYIRLRSGYIIDIPDFADNVYMFLSPENLHYFKSQFDSGTAVDETLKRLVVGQKIVDFHSIYENNELDWFSGHYIELANGMYVTENRSGPIGLTGIDLFVLDKKRFTDKTSGDDVRSFLATRKDNRG